MLRRTLSSRRAWVLALVACAGLGVWLATSSHRKMPTPGRTSSLGSYPSPIHKRATHPNIVFVLTDDLSLDLLRLMPHVQAMQRRGLTFRNYFVSDSLCCPSRATIFTGNFPHDTGVFRNFGPNGGFHAFYSRHEEAHTFAVALQRAGYVTGLMGKYLNGYMEYPGQTPDGTAPSAVPANYVPVGWSDWNVAGPAYREFNYSLNQNGVLHSYGGQPSEYLTDVLAKDGNEFIDLSAAAHRPFFLELATFAPHSPYVPAPRDAHDFPGAHAPRPPSFNVLPTHAPRWLAGRRPLRGSQIKRIDLAFRRRAQSVQAVDRMIGRIEQTLRADGIANNTYLIFSSDNGLHTGQYGLMPGKLTAFDTDIRVPLVVAGPGVPAHTKTSAMTENVDLARTFAAIAGTKLPGDGHSLLPLLHGNTGLGWRNAILVEHRGALMHTIDPDFQQSASGSPTTYEAMRTRQFLYVEYRDGERELYDLRHDPFELHNLASRLSALQRALLHADLARIENCHTASTCWSAMHSQPIGTLASP